MTFGEFFRELHGIRPFHWQQRLAEQVSEGDWPDVLALPTASGKTACVDIAVFAMAKQAHLGRTQRTAPRRVFFVVDRRVIVDEVFQRMKDIREKLCDAKNGVLKDVANALRHLAGNGKAEPLVVHEMRGGIFRDQAWIRNPAQPAVIASTVDQTGSRLLFQGYGVSSSAKPIHAALIANDALIVLDEAHCSVPFRQTLEWVRKYREMGGVAESLRMPFHVVEMSATPSGSDAKHIFSLPAEDRAQEFLGRRLRASKPAELIPVRKGGRRALEEELVRHATRLADADGRVKNIVIFVNRVASARAVYEKLCGAGRNVRLMVGRMRPIDRDDLTVQVQDRLKSGAPPPSEETPALFVVATQCLEVGADYDFDALVTECASIDALRQRFGRLNRLGRDGIQARAVILAPAGKLAGDPVYGDDIDSAWTWLNKLSPPENGIPIADFANEGTGTVGDAIAGAPKAKVKDAPVLFREYLDIWSQTNPAPEPQPDSGYFLHGPDYESDDIYVVWRADLERASDWEDIVSLCPPSSAEAMPVSLRAFRKWLAGVKASETEADVAIAAVEERKPARPFDGRRFLVWRGTKKTEVLLDANKVRPGDTIVVPESYTDLADLGYIPGIAENHRIDRGEEALLNTKRRACLRVHPALTRHWLERPGKIKLQKALESGDQREVTAAIEQYRDELPEGQWPKRMLDHLLEGFDAIEYPAETALDTRAWLLRSKHMVTTDEDDGEDDLSLSDHRISLADHTEHVRQWAAAFIKTLGLDELKADFEAAASMHDWGKADARFQALLLGGERIAAGFSPKLLAKSAQIGLSKAERARQRALSGIPDGFRHEFLSLQLAESSKAGSYGENRDLVLHLIASHHGWARPFAPVVLDEELPAVSLATAGLSLRWSSDERLAAIAPHSLAGGVPDRFWRLTRSLGWWGLAYVEAIFRLADWSASEHGSPSQKSEARAA